ncbi:SMAD/FHA domain-containing protein [Sporodiniella umbellata]|nr:SMAD/FHA domain-containing protein [Sporodiniella umbellata]
MTVETRTLRVVPHLDSSQALIFPVVEYSLSEDQILKIGRSTLDKRNSPTLMSFRSKVVSRKHAEIFMENEHVYIKDTGSSSGTFLNSRRLSPPNETSSPHILRNNDTVQLGVDYQGGTEEYYRCVRMRIEINKPNQETSNQEYNIKTYNTLQNMIKPREDNQDNSIHVDECCICLFAIAPFQALFVAPCSHTFHYKCLRPLLANHPGFVCPLCRHYSDLEENVSMEVDEVKTMLKSLKES